jgi:hypothetical protein
VPDVSSDQASHWRRTWADWKRPLTVAVAVTVALRVVTTVIALVSTYGVSFPHIVAQNPLVLANVWSHWDTGYYLTIARHGYPAGRQHNGAIPSFAAFGPAYPFAVAVLHAVSRMDWVWTTQVVSALATAVGMAGLVHLADRDQGQQVSNLAVTMLAAFPTAFFLLAGYPESLALSFLVWAFIAARADRWLLAGLAAAGAAMTNYYLAIVLVALVVEYWQSRPSDRRWPTDWMHDVVRPSFLIGPSVVFFGVWMVVCSHLYRDPLAFIHVQANWNRHFAFPWTLAHRTIGDLAHLRFLDTSVASVMELFDTVTVLLLAVITVIVFVHVRRSYGVLLGISLCVYTFQTILYSETREVLVLFPFFVGMGRWVAGHPWRERFVLACFLPSAYFLIDRFVNGRFAG